jgi:tricorn protease
MFVLRTARLGPWICLVGLSALSGGQLPDPKVEPIVGARSLALSADGSKLAFVYRGDVWTVDARGGRAVPVTTHVALDDNPVWSPDGKWIAFSSDRNGGNDIYVVPAEGGRPQQLSFVGGMIPGDWSPDGTRIVIDTNMDKRWGGIYEIEVAGGRIHEMLLDPRPINRPKYSADGRSVVYERMGFPWFRPRYSGSAAAEAWSVDRNTKATKKWADTSFQQLWPAMSGSNVMAVTVSELTPSSSPMGKSIGKFTDNAKRTPNVYELTGSGVRQVTSFVGGAVRDLAISRRNNVGAFTYEGGVYTMQGGRDPRKIDIIASGDDKTGFIERLVLVDSATGGSLSPDGSQVVFVVRDELWLVPTKKGEGPNKDDATQLSDWPGLDRSPMWAPDGKSVFFTSDRDGAERVYRLDVATKQATAISLADNDATALRFSPDRKHLYFWVSDELVGGLYRVAVESNSAELVMRLPSEYAAGFDVSPDGRYIAYSYANSGTMINQAPNINIFVFDTTTKQSRQITRLNAQHFDPVWSPDGKYLFFTSNRSGGGGGFGGGGGGVGGGSTVHVLPLKRENARQTEMDRKYVKPEGAVTVEIDFADTDSRVRQFMAQSPQGQIAINPTDGVIYWLSGGNVWRAGYDGEGARQLSTTGGITSFEPDKDWGTLFLIVNGKPATMNIKQNNAPVTVIDFRAEWTRQIDGERRAAFAQFWRGFNSGFYDPNMHGRDWVAVRKRYEPLLSSIGHPNEFSTVLNMMTGELESSHSEVSGSGTPGGPSGPSVVHPGFTIDWSYNGPGIKVAEVPFNAPGSFEKTRISAGEIVLQINGVEVGPNMALYRDVLTGQSGRDMTFLVSPDGLRTTAREVKYRAVSGGALRGIYSDNQLLERRKYVEEKSGGKLTYIHISGMGGGNLAAFNREFWEYALGKEGVIIDVRDNGGGNIADQLVDMIERRPHAYYQSRDGVAATAPGRDVTLELVVMHNETSYSNAEMFPSAMKSRGLATLVGVQTPGYVIWTSGFRLVDGTNARMPNSASFRLDGTPMENLGQAPDIAIDNTREDILAGRDPQLDKAIEVLLGKLKK